GIFCPATVLKSLASREDAYVFRLVAEQNLLGQNDELIFCPLLSEISGKMRFVQSLFALVAVGLYGKCLQVSTINLLTRALFYGAKINIIIIN
ncbi:MAG: hypothetical protein AAF847_20185, partial [Bacteroidota bacterium]